MNLIITKKHKKHVQMTESPYKLASCFFKEFTACLEVAFIDYRITTGKHILFIKKSVLPNRNIFYDISLSHKQKHVFVLVSIGRKVLQSALCACGFSCSDTITSSRVLSSV